MLAFLGRTIGIGFGAGLSPIAPGTVGSLAAVAVYYLLSLISGPQAPYLLVALIVLGTAVGVWATGLLSSPDNEDPGQAVWDEFVGMWITCLFLPTTVLWLLAAFLVFRVLDVVKPWPANRLENLPGGWGIMADDVVAGIYGAILLNVVHMAWRLWG